MHKQFYSPYELWVCNEHILQQGSPPGWGNYLVGVAGLATEKWVSSHFSFSLQNEFAFGVAALVARTGANSLSFTAVGIHGQERMPIACVYQPLVIFTPVPVPQAGMQ